MYHFSDPIPDCVPEHYRARQEDEDRRYEQQMQRRAHYLANREKLDAAIASGLPILDYGGYGPCWECQTADHDTATDADDDFDRVICLNPSCPHYQTKEAS